MKKIISMLCVIAMMLSFAVISASASGEKIYLVENTKEATDDKLAFDVVIECAEGIKVSTVQVKYDGFLTNNKQMTTSDFSAKTVSGASASNVTAQNFISTNYTDMSQSNPIVTLCTIYVEKANFKNDAAFYFTANSQVNGVKSYATAGLEIKAPVSVNTITGTIETVAAADEIDGEKTDWQIGSGMAITVDTTEIGTISKMIWAITVDEVRKFSEAFAPISNELVDGQVKFAATFINGDHTKGEEAVAFSEVGAIFNAENGVYFTNADDAKYEAKANE